MTLKLSMRMGLLGAGAILLAPTAGLANQLNFNTITPVRPQIHLGPSLRMDVRSRDVYDLDLSNDCRPDERRKTLERKRRCRQGR